MSKLESINFNQNIKTFAINGDENNVIKLNTSDYGIFTRHKEKANELEDFEKLAVENEDKIAEMEEAEKTVRDLLNYIFNSDVCTPAFGKTNCLSPCDGMPLFVGFLNALMGIVERDMQAENKKMEANISKYTNQLPQLTE